MTTPARDHASNTGPLSRLTGNAAVDRLIQVWYGHQQRLLDVATGTALWHTDGCTR